MMDVPASSSDILELLSQILQFKLFEVNRTAITILSICIFTLAILTLILVSKFFQHYIVKRVLGHFDLERGIEYTVRRIIHYAFMTVGILVAFQFIGLDLSALAVIFGLLSVGIGFGLQNVTSNFVSGLILLLERPIRVGDRVTVGDTEGDVIAINMRSTTIKSTTNISIIVPNSEFVASQVINWSHGDRKIRLDIVVGVAYDSDLDKVLEALLAVAREEKTVMEKPAPDVLLDSFGDSSWNMILRVWIPDPFGHHKMRSNLNCAIVRKFRELDIEIPFPQRDLHIRSPLPVPLINSDA